jgi:hypothetical protein
VATLLTQVVVDPADTAFVHPTKPIGPVYTQEGARRLAAAHGWAIAPDASAFDLNEAEAAIAQATREADEQNVQGKLVTPFVLKRVAEITGGKAMAGNRALLVNNARVAAQIAAAL